MVVKVNVNARISHEAPSGRVVSTQGLERCSSVNKHTNLVVCLFLTDVRKVTESVDTSSQVWPMAILVSERSITCKKNKQTSKSICLCTIVRAKQSILRCLIVI